MDDFPDPDTVQAAQSRAAVITGLVARERPTLCALHQLAGARGHFTIAGSPERMADVIESALNNRQSLYWRAFKGETGLLELQDTGILTFETLQILTRSEWVRKHV